MEESIKEAIDEFKRADHLMYVSLKYTRTGDVILSLVERLAASIDKCMDALYKFKGIKDVPTAPVSKANTIKSEFPDDEKIQEMMNIFLTFRKVRRSEKEVAGEFRRTLNLTVMLPDEEPLVLDIDSMQEYYNKTKIFLSYIKEMILGED